MRTYQAKAFASIMLFFALVATGGHLVLFENGNSNYQIVVPDKESAMSKKCVEELNYHIKEATGVELRVCTVSQRDASNPAILLCIPPANAAKYETPNGFAIQVVGKDIHIFGDDVDGGGFVYYWRDDAFDKRKGDFTRYGTLFGVYEFLERAFNVRWLWPGKLGEYIPKTCDAVWKDDLVIDQQRLIHSRIRYQPWRRPKQAWTNEKNKSDFEKATYAWILRNRMVRSASMEYGHSYYDWFNKYGKTNTKIFNQLPDGTRRSDPYYNYGNPSVVSMCVSNKALVKLKIRQWQENRGKLPFVNLAENDTAAKCVCKACLALDVPDPANDVAFKERAAEAAKRFKAGDVYWYRALGSLTDRYCVYYNRVLAKAKRIDSGAKAVVYAYSNYRKPPLKTKLSKDVIVEYVPLMGYPWKDAERQVFRDEWMGWKDSGASLFLRPNYTLRGHNFPIYYADELAEDFAFAWTNGLVGTDFDSLTGQYATQGLNAYVCARIHYRGNLSKDEIFSEYFRAFGPAEKEIREYFAYLKEVAQNSGEIASKNFLGLNYAGFAGDFLSMPSIYTLSVLDECMRMLDNAEAKTENGSVERQRVQFLKNGIRHARLNTEAQMEFEKHKNGGDIGAFAKALDKLDKFRADIEGDFGCDFGFLYSCDSFAWTRDVVKMQSMGTLLEAKWLFAFDAEKVGEKERFFSPDHNTMDWTPIEVGKSYNEQEPNLSWVKERKADYTGVCWYKTRFRLAPKDDAKKIEIVFGAVDEACKVYFNGQLLLDRPYPYKGNANSWEEPFAVDVTSLLKTDGDNDLSVMVINNYGQGGLFRPVYVRKQ